MAPMPIIVAITSANQMGGGTKPTSPASAAHPNKAPVEAAPNTRNRPRGSRWRSAINAHAPMPMPVAITTRCMRSIIRLTARVYAAYVMILASRGHVQRFIDPASLKEEIRTDPNGARSPVRTRHAGCESVLSRNVRGLSSGFIVIADDSTSIRRTSSPSDCLVSEEAQDSAAEKNLKNKRKGWFPRPPIAHRITPHGRWGPRLQRALSARH
jgi:hypothetical protein